MSPTSVCLGFEKKVDRTVDLDTEKEHPNRFSGSFNACAAVDQSSDQNHFELRVGLPGANGIRKISVDAFPSK